MSYARNFDNGFEQYQGGRTTGLYLSLNPSAGLLACYNVGLKEFYDWFIGSHTLVVLLLESIEEHRKWPDDVRCEAKRLLDYFAAPTMLKEVYTSQG